MAQPGGVSLHGDRGEFSHEALLYAGQDEFLDGVVPFLQEGIASGEPVLIVVSAPRCAVLREIIGADYPGSSRLAAFRRRTAGRRVRADRGHVREGDPQATSRVRTFAREC